MLPMPTSASTSSTGAFGVEPATLSVRCASMPSSRPPSTLTSPTPGLGVDLERDVLRHRDHEAADAEACVDGRGAGRERDGTEVDIELSHAELVARLECGKGRGLLVLIPDARGNRDRRRCSNPERREQDQPEEDESADASLRHRSDRDRHADNCDACGERDREVDVVHVEHRKQAEQTGGRKQCAEHRREERRPRRRARRRWRARGWCRAGGRCCAWHGVGCERRCVGCRRRRARPAVAIRDVPPDERRAAERGREPQVAGAGPEARLGERQERSEGEQAHPEEKPGAVTVPAKRSRPRTTPRSARPG